MLIDTFAMLSITAMPIPPIDLPLACRLNACLRLTVYFAAISIFVDGPMSHDGAVRQRAACNATQQRARLRYCARKMAYSNKMRMIDDFFFAADVTMRDDCAKRCLRVRYKDYRRRRRRIAEEWLVCRCRHI